jgi:hypothetical protein
MKVYSTWVRLTRPMVVGRGNTMVVVEEGTAEVESEDGLSVPWQTKADDSVEASAVDED